MTRLFLLHRLFLLNLTALIAIAISGGGGVASQSSPQSSSNTNNPATAAATVQPSTYRLIGSASTYAQYSPWYACLNGSLAFEFKTHEPNGLLLYAQSLPYKYVQISLVDGRVRLRMRLGERDDPRGEFLVQQPIVVGGVGGVKSTATRLNDEKWHEVKLVRLNERTVLEVDGETYFHVHAHASLDGNDLLFGEIDPVASNYLYNGYINWIIFL